MTLDQYLKSDGAPSLTDLAAAIGISKGRLSQLKGEDGAWPPDLALTAEEKTEGRLDAAALSSVIARARQQAA